MTFSSLQQLESKKASGLANCMTDSMTREEDSAVGRSSMTSKRQKSSIESPILRREVSLGGEDSGARTIAAKRRDGNVTFHESAKRHDSGSSHAKEANSHDVRQNFAKTSQTNARQAKAESEDDIMDETTPVTPVQDPVKEGPVKRGDEYELTVFSMEVLCAGPQERMLRNDPAKDAVLAICYAIKEMGRPDKATDSQGVLLVSAETLFEGLPMGCHVTSFDSEKDLLEGFEILISEKDPDLLVGFEVCCFLSCLYMHMYLPGYVCVRHVLIIDRV